MDTHWGKEKTETYLKTCSIPTDVSSIIFDKCNAIKQSTLASNKEINESTPASNEEIDDGFADSHQVMFTDYDYVPYVWLSCVSISAWIDAGMHHIFHGIMGSIMNVVSLFMKSEDKAATFESLVNPHLIEIQYLRLDWCHVKILPKLQWLAEDELGFSRIQPFIYGAFFLSIDLKYASNFTKHAMLSLRQMLHLLHVMVAVLMSPRDPPVFVIDCLIKIFLSCIHCSPY